MPSAIDRWDGKNPLKADRSRPILATRFLLLLYYYYYLSTLISMVVQCTGFCVFFFLSSYGIPLFFFFILRTYPLDYFFSYMRVVTNLNDMGRRSFSKLFLGSKYMKCKMWRLKVILNGPVPNLNTLPPDPTDKESMYLKSGASLENIIRYAEATSISEQVRSK